MSIVYTVKTIEERALIDSTFKLKGDAQRRAQRLMAERTIHNATTNPNGRVQTRYSVKIEEAVPDYPVETAKVLNPLVYRLTSKIIASCYKVREVALRFQRRKVAPHKAVVGYTKYLWGVGSKQARGAVGVSIAQPREQREIGG